MVLEAALRLESIKRLGAGELSLVLGLSGMKVDVVGNRGDESEALRSMFEEADLMSLFGLNSGVVACGDGVLPRPEEVGLDGVMRDTNPAMSESSVLCSWG